MTDKSRKHKNRIPEFKSIEEEAAFWDTHSFADYWDELEPVTLRARKNLTHTMNVRIDPEDIAKLQKEAEKKGVGSSTLARMWIKERLHGHH
jgi:predicted HicB family RNase H-like nuclease